MATVKETPAEEVGPRSQSPPDLSEILFEARREVAFSTDVAVIPSDKDEPVAVEWIQASPIMNSLAKLLEGDGEP